MTNTRTLTRTKALLFALVRAFEFELAFDPKDMKTRSGIVQRPIIHSGPEAAKKAQLPLIVKAYRPL